MQCSSMAVAFRCCFSPSHPWSNSKFPGRHSVLIRGTDRSSFSFRCGGNINGGCCPSSTVRVYVGSDCGEKPLYHPFEEVEVSDGWKDGEEGDGSGGPARISDAVLTRTLVEVHSKAALMLSGVIGDEVHGNIFWPQIPYVTDENGDIYIEVRNEEDILQNLTAENNFVQVIIGLDNLEMLPEMELANQQDIDFGIEEIKDEASDEEDEDDYDEDWVTIIDEEESEYESSDGVDNWTSLETMRSCHPVYFANKISEVISNLHLNWMDQPANGLAIQGTLRPVFPDEKTIIQRHKTGKRSSDDIYQNKKDPNHLTSSMDKKVWEDKVEQDNSQQSGTTFYKLEMIDIQLVSAHGSQTLVEVEDFHQAQPDVVAQSAVKILSHFKADAVGTIKAIKSLCQRCKGILAEEAAIIGIDSLGFDVRVSMGAQVETLRFSFSAQATSVFDAEQKLQDLLIPRLTQDMPTKEGCQQEQ